MTDHGEPRWLDAEERAAWLSWIAATTLLEAALDRQLQRDAGMPMAYYQILVMLSEAPDRTLRMGELADRTLSSHSRISHAVSRLEERGWVRRETCPGDRRRTFCTLTDEGLAVLAAAAPGHVNEVRKYLFDRLTREQVRQLMEITNEIRAGLTGEFVDPTEGAPAHV
ncbi:DNA-binding transcriptional regulator, MarR family [Pseudonocardia thermophila]|uniref:DNA-binding transcriptional regulator, MarR family n=1 Tax=Pseudonocardia thermophila TaxID=1848 RepID=A0A1M6YBX0_PSETH|nr:MarR family transcriptional regulator [Pseudonocardia thermophila]SHL15439.1 DNA-binding transcriptional regulator, MarR family [Pseudonocardia thermophila]